MKVVLASNNKKKLKELRRILDTAGLGGVELVGLGEVADYPEPRETGRTFAENALIKARAAAEHTGLVAIADDSGLSIEELGGMPGVLSARWSGGHGDDAANNSLVLAQLADTPAERRAAAFVSVCALVDPRGGEQRGPDGAQDAGPKADGGVAAGRGVPRGVGNLRPGEALSEGRWEGRILDAPRGAGGFGYDPLFLPAEEDPEVTSGAVGRSAAELSAQEKDALSHRGKALAGLVPEIARRAGRG